MPGRDTAKTGFVLERHGVRTKVRPASDLFTHAVNTYSGGTKQDVLYFRGLIAVSRSDRRRIVTIPLSDLRTVFPLEVGTRRAVTVVQAYRDKAGPPVSLELAVAGREKLQVGTCTYEVLAIRNRYLLRTARCSRSTPTSIRPNSPSSSAGVSRMADGRRK